MLNQEELKNVAALNNTSKVVFDTLSKRVRFRRQTNLTNFHNDLMNKGEKIVESEFMDAFKALQILGVGSLIFGRNGKPNRFKWNYNLKDVAKVALNQDEAEINEMPTPAPIKRGRGRPRKNAMKQAKTIKVHRGMKISASPSIITITLQISANSRPEDIAALLDLAKQLK